LRRRTGLPKPPTHLTVHYRIFWVALSNVQNGGIPYFRRLSGGRPPWSLVLVLVPLRHRTGACGAAALVRPAHEKTAAALVTVHQGGRGLRYSHQGGRSAGRPTRTIA
jgi:hypothetical protein